MIPGGKLVLSLKHLNRIRSVDVTNYSLTAEAGLHSVAGAAGGGRGRVLLPAEAWARKGSCQIGGNLSTNAGGVNVLRYA